MKLFKSGRFTVLHWIILLVILVLSFLVLANVWDATNKLVFQQQELDGLRLDRPIIRIYHDVFFYLHEDVLRNDPGLYQKVQQSEIIFKTVMNVSFLVLIILVLLQLNSLLHLLRRKSFFHQENLRCVRRMALLLLIWVFVDNILYQSIQFAIPDYLIQDIINYTPINENFFEGILFSLDYKMLLASFAFYVISVGFKEGYQLKEQADFTI